MRFQPRGSHDHPESGAIYTILQLPRCATPLALKGPSVSSRRFQPAERGRPVNRPTPMELTLQEFGPSQGRDCFRSTVSVGFTYGYSQYPTSWKSGISTR